jgi:hypothetical protein
VIHAIRFKPPPHHCPFVIDAEGLCTRGSRHIDSCVFPMDASYEPMSHSIRIDVVSDDGARVQTLLRESILALVTGDPELRSIADLELDWIGRDPAWAGG